MAFGIKLDVTNVVTDKLLTDNTFPTLMLPAVKLPVTFAVPLMFAPVPVTTNTLVLPDALILTFPLELGILTLLLPLLMLDVLIPTQLNPPEPFVCNTYPLVPPVIVTLPTAPKLVVPETVRLLAEIIFVFKLPKLALPVIVTKLLVLLNVNAVLVLALPWSLNTTPVLEPGITMLPEILPTTLPMKFGA